ncbi:MAG: DUF2279 domain-containing protein [Flavobacteriales bacterium]|jgi:hypothetical protein|nr:DUF2279 domain-containing protein [Flavobacteriales bacterium]NCG29891.1 DUF2279 domain-containing protein [Bacteroidota bacterium]MBT3962777.1 DUF2279 domain-containing protein [Flavobacteriales bacterium]MBT4704558.1 DUF2279 domain-containing protein [Flavobacteriales bacterium]MBT4929540.1 DUF2279 domain-containing protein [Flavobacteriales bacterium]
MRWLVVVYSLIFMSTSGSAQKWHEPSDTLNKQRANFLTIGQSCLWLGSQAGLYMAWYSQYDQEPFHFFNDWPGWMQMDKVGHVAATYQEGWILYKMNRWAGMTEKRARNQALIMSYGFQTTFEVMDGFSSGWGFSWYDQAANTVGSGLFWAQQKAWGEQRIITKFSFWQSGLTNAPWFEGSRARTLYGKSVFEQWLKDYNGQTYWLSANVWSLVGKPDRFPKWLNIAVGYSVDNMLGAESNSWDVITVAGQSIEELPYTSPLIRQRQYLLSLDIDLSHVDLPPYLTWVKPVFGLVKFPFPALEINSHNGLRGHAIYF